MTTHKFAEGLTLHVIKETKFKTVKIMVRFRERLTETHLGKRVLISNMLETTNQVYQTGTAFSRQLSEMYGASFTTGVAKKGNQHLLTINMNVVNPKFVDTDTVSQAIDFIKTALFQPDVSADGFNPEVFKREQTNLIHYLESMNDDRSYFASRKLASLFFTDKAQALPSISTVDLLKEETPEAVYAYYNEMLKTNVIDIFVLGDVDEEAICAAFETFPLEGRKISNNVIYQQKRMEEPVEITEEKEVAQSILQLAFYLPVTYGDKDYLALQVMNGLFGGFTHSKLFANVREMESLAYSISSTFDSFSGFFKIAAGIDAQNYEKAKALIFEQLEAMKTGDFTEEAIAQTKTMLRNTYLIGQDSASNNVELAYVKALLPTRYMTQEQFLTGLEAVTKVDIKALAQEIIYQAQYFMKGSSLQLEAQED